jgi:hypothetical protein
MTTRNTKIATLGAAALIVASFLALSGALAPVLAATATSHTSPSTATVATTSSGTIPGLSVGQVITITGTEGHYYVVGDKAENGTASGALTFTVTGRFAGGYSLSITSGSLTVNGTTYTVSSGSTEMGHYAHHMVGQGTVTGTATGAFLMKATARGTFGGEYATMSLDLKSGAAEYALFLVGTVQG